LSRVYHNDLLRSVALFLYYLLNLVGSSTHVRIPIEIQVATKGAILEMYQLCRVHTEMCQHDKLYIGYFQRSPQY
jgi:hypothetical protein